LNGRFGEPRRPTVVSNGRAGVEPLARKGEDDLYGRIAAVLQYWGGGGVAVPQRRQR
jgi:hypothetical protein